MRCETTISWSKRFPNEKFLFDSYENKLVKKSRSSSDMFLLPLFRKRKKTFLQIRTLIHTRLSDTPLSHHHQYFFSFLNEWALISIHNYEVNAYTKQTANVTTKGVHVLNAFLCFCVEFRDGELCYEDKYTPFFHLIMSLFNHSLS